MYYIRKSKQPKANSIASKMMLMNCQVLNSIVLLVPQEAKAKFHKVVTPFIDHLSYKANCPIHIPLISSEDVKNRCIMINYTSPYPIAKLNPHESHLDTKMIPIYALYREAKNSDSCYYKFLCYYKILREGIYKHLRPDLYKLARERNIEIQKQKELVPDHPELKKFIPSSLVNQLNRFLIMNSKSNIEMLLHIFFLMMVQF